MIMCLHIIYHFFCLISDLLEEPLTKREIPPIRKAKLFYKSCMDIGEFTKHGQFKYTLKYKYLTILCFAISRLLSPEKGKNRI